MVPLLVTATAKPFLRMALPTAVSSGAGDGSLTATTATTYTADGDVSSVDGPLAGTADKTVFWYDDARQQIGVVGPDPDGGGALANRAVRTSYNADGQVTAVERGTVTTQSSWPTTFTTLLTQNTAYNGLGQPVTQTLVGGGSIQQMLQYEYDAAGRLVCTAQRLNPAYFAAPSTAACTLTLVAQNLGPDRIARSSYDAANRVTKLTQGYGSVSPADEWTLTYTNNGQTATLTDANGNLTTYVYDGAGRLSRIRFPNAAGGGSSSSDYEEYSYDAGSNLTLDRRRDATTITNTIDNLNRITQLAPSSNGPTISYTYDNFGRRLTAAQSGHTLSFSYDQLSRNLTQQSSVLGTVSYQYDLAGRRTRMTWPDAFYVTYAYDNANDLTGILENGTTSLAAYTYDNLGRQTLLTRDGSANTTEAAAYDNASNLSQLVQNLPSTAYDQSIDLSHNAAAQITSRTGSNASYQWSPIAPGTTSSTANGLNQYTASGGASLSYDGRGNLTNAGGVSFGYDIYNRMISAPSSVSFAYDPAGRLYQISAAAATRFLYDGADIIAEYDTSGNVLRRYVHGLSGPMVWYEGAGTSSHRWLIPDERGSIIARDNAGSVSINSYDEYGNNGSANAGRFQYLGMPWIAEAGLYQMGARAYAPGIGRWMQTDPILTAGGVNLYAYVGNDPVNLADPSGLDVVCDASGRNCSETGHGEEVIVTACPHQSICGEQARDELERLREASVSSPQEVIQDDSFDEDPRLRELICSQYEQEVERTKSALGQSYPNSWRWNSLAALNYDFAMHQYNANEASTLAYGFGIAGTAAAKAPPTVSVPLGTASLGYSWFGGQHQAAANALAARIAQLEHEMAGLCPVQGAN